MSERAVLLGLDPSTVALGWATCDLKTGRPSLCSAVNLATLRADLGSLEAALFASLEQISDTIQGKVELIYCEKLFVGRSRKITVILSECVGAVLMGCDVIWPGIPRERFVPQEWKRGVGLAGNANKSQVKTKAFHLGWDTPTQDAADAACIASAGWKMNQEGKYE